MSDIRPLTKDEKKAARVFGKTWAAMEKMELVNQEMLDDLLSDVSVQLRHCVRSELGFARMETKKAKQPNLASFLVRWTLRKWRRAWIKSAGSRRHS